MQITQLDTIPSVVQGDSLPLQLIRLILARDMPGIQLAPSLVLLGDRSVCHSAPSSKALQQLATVSLTSQGKDERSCCLARSQAGVAADVDRTHLPSKANTAFVNSRVLYF